MGDTRILVHGTAVGLGDRAVLLRGPSGAGKSDLALRLLALSSELLIGLCLPGEPARLIADDQVWLDRHGDHIVASAPETLRGRIEVRGVGIVHVSATPSAMLHLIVDLVPAVDVPRLPLDTTTEIVIGRPIRAMRLSAFEASAPLKVALALLGHPDLS